MKLATLAAIAPLALVAGCIPFPSSNEDGGGDVHMWISSDKDTYVSCGNPMQGCPEKDRTFGTSNQLVAAEWDLGIKKTYLHFTPPTLPPGAEILEAYLEVYHSGKNEDGNSDELQLPIDFAGAAWSPNTLTYANQPNQQLFGSFTTLALRSQAWSSTPDVAGLVQQWLDDPAANHGVVLYWSSPSQNAEKGFYSNNHTSRKVNDLGLAPRLLVKVRFADGTTTADMTLGALPPDHDLALGSEVLMVRYVASETWPGDWRVAH